MQGSGNITRTYKQKDRDVRHDPKRNKKSSKNLVRKERRFKQKGMEE